VPLPIDDLRYTIDEKGVQLAWTMPVKTVKGTDLSYISSFDVYRAVVPLADLCNNCPIPFGEPAEVGGGVTTEQKQRKTAEYRTSLLRSGHKYFFKVRSRTSWWADSADSNIVSFVWHVPTSPPQGVTATPEGGGIKVDWLVVTSLLDGREAEGEIVYQVFRSEGGKEFEPLGAPVVRSNYTDTSVVPGQKYFYRVQSLLNYQGNMVNGGTSDIVSGIKADDTPLEKVAGVGAIKTKSGVKVFWNRSGDERVAGYRIYRRTAKQKQPELLAEVPPTNSLYVDASAPADGKVFYSVTAIDASNPVLESAPSDEVTSR
jgi:fibronectin type 3 domain-containing protein